MTWKWDFTTFRMNIISIRKSFVDMDIVNDVTYRSQSVITCVFSRFYDTMLFTE